MLLALVVISYSSSAGRFITQSRSFWIIGSVLSLWYLPGPPLFVWRLLKVFSKLPFVQKSCKILVEMSLPSIYKSCSSEYANQRSVYYGTLVRSALQYSITFSSSYLSCETGAGFSNWRYRNRVELLFKQGLTLLTWKVLYIKFRLGSEERS